MPCAVASDSVDANAVIESKIYEMTTSDLTVEELYRFGQQLLTELQQRWSEVDRKLTILLGWSIAVLGVVLFDHRINTHSNRWLFDAAAVLATSSVLMAALGLRTRLWRVASKNDWFQNKLWDAPSMLKRHHLVSMLYINDENARSLNNKAEQLARVEILLPLSAIAAFTALLFS